MAKPARNIQYFKICADQQSHQLNRFYIYFLTLYPIFQRVWSGQIGSNRAELTGPINRLSANVTYT